MVTPDKNSFSWNTAIACTFNIRKNPLIRATFLLSGLIAGLFCPALSAQDTLYYDRDFNLLLVPDSARFMEVRKCDVRDTSRCVVMTWLMHGNLIAVMRYSNYAEHILNGRCSYWYENGSVFEEAIYKNDKKQGVESVFYPNGQLKRKVLWDNDSIVSGSFFQEDGTPKTEVFLHEAFLDEWEQPPAFPGGSDSLLYYLMQNIYYPEKSRENNEQGVVLASFVVDRNGAITKVQIEESVSPLIDEVALKVLRKMPRWEPGRINGIPVRVRLTVPLRFKLE